MKGTFNYRLRSLMLPGLKRWILVIFFGIAFIVFGVFLLMGYHPLTLTGSFLREIMENAADVLPHRISGFIVITGGALILCLAIVRITLAVVGAYLPQDREPILDVLYRRRHLDRGPKIVVIGGGTGLSNLLKGLKNYTNNITAIVTVGDDGGSSGRLRQELGVLPPGDIRNCITALADEEKLVTELFRYRFEAGEGLEGHSFGNLFLTAICSITNGDMLQATRVASRVLNSCGQVLPSTLRSITLVAKMRDGEIVKGESQITKTAGQIERIFSEPSAEATPEAVEAIRTADLIILGPGSLYTSIVPNLLIEGIPEAIRKAKAHKVYVCNVMTQVGETINYSVADHLKALLIHSDTPPHQANKFIQTVLVNDEIPDLSKYHSQNSPVYFDPERIKEYGINIVKEPLLSSTLINHHDSDKLAKLIVLSFLNPKKHRPLELRRKDGSLHSSIA